MRPRDLMLAALVPTAWGLAFIAIKVGLATFTPTELVVLRFLIAASPALVLARPPIGWAKLFAIGLFLFAGQFILLFLGIAWGMPTGLASVVAQTQAFFTVLLAAIFLRELPTRRQLLGMAVALAGLVLMALTPIVVALPLSVAMDGPASLPERFAHLSWPTIVAVLYLGLVATVFTYVVWANLLRRYSAAMVAPFTLLIPFAGALSSWIVFGERFGPVRLAGMALVIAGVAIVLVPFDRLMARWR